MSEIVVRYEFEELVTGELRHRLEGLLGHDVKVSYGYVVDEPRTSAGVVTRVSFDGPEVELLLEVEDGNPTRLEVGVAPRPSRLASAEEVKVREGLL